jgi:signal transduction histidine kinase
MQNSKHHLPEADHRQAIDLLTILRVTRWTLPAILSLIGFTYTAIEHQRHVNDPAWPLPTIFAIAVLSITGPVLTWFVLHWAFRTAAAYSESQEQLAYRAEQLAILNQLSTETSRSVLLKDRIETILQYTIDALNATAGMVFIKNSHHADLQLEAYQGISAAMADAESQLKPGHCLCGQSIETREILFANNLEDDSRCTSDFCVCEGLRSVACAPLEVKGQLVGLLQLASPLREHFTQEQMEFLHAAAAQVSFSIENARLYDQIRTFNVELEKKINLRTKELETARWELAEKARQLQRLLSESYLIQEDTQSRIANDMHDGVTQMIIGSLYEIEAARSTIFDNPDKAVENLTHAQEHLTEVEREIKRVIYDLHPPVLDMLGLVVALKRFATTYTQTFEIDCRVHVSGNQRRLPKETEIAIYRIIQAALQNVASHAQARQVTISFVFNFEQLFVQVIDNGIGFDPEIILKTPGDHLGLIGMKERADGLGANLRIDSHKGLGTQVEFCLPSPVYMDE